MGDCRCDVLHVRKPDLFCSVLGVLLLEVLGLVSQINGDRVLFLVLDFLDLDADKDLLLDRHAALQSVTVLSDQLSSATVVYWSQVFKRLLDFENLHIVQV